MSNKNNLRRESRSVLRGCVAAAAILAEFGSPAMAAEDFTTTDRTIQDRDDDRLLELGPGEKVMLRQDSLRRDRAGLSAGAWRRQGLSSAQAE